MEEVYEALVNLWQKERTSSELISLPERFLNELTEYFAFIRRQIRLSDKESLNTKIRSAEFGMMQRLLESLLKIRMRKIMSLVHQPTELQNFLPFEKKTFNIIQRVLSQHESMIKNSLNNPRILQRDLNRRYEVVVFLKDFPKFVGEDLNSYGPFKAGDVASICSENVPALVMKNVVKPIKSV